MIGRSNPALRSRAARGRLAPSARPELGPVVAPTRSSIASGRTAFQLASSHRRLYAFSADHDRGGFRAILLHNDEDLAPSGELIGRRLVKGDDHRARRDGDRLFAAGVIEPEHTVRSDLLNLADIGVGNHVRPGLKIPGIWPSGQTRH